MRNVHKAMGFSSTTKMPCLSWSLVAQKHCIVKCSYCYGTKGHYSMYANVNALRERNDADWRRSDWTERMVNALSDQQYFRWFDTGDIYNVELAQKILDVCKATPNTKHWIPTKAYVSKAILPYLEKLAKLPNVVVRYSNLKLDDYAQNKGTHRAVVSTGKVTDREAFQCRPKDGKCERCRVCWERKIKTVVYAIH